MRAAVTDCPYDGIVAIESWWNDSVKSAEVFDEKEWVVYRRDRGSRGGGVLIAIRTKYQSRMIPITASDVEQLWVNIQLVDKCLNIGAAYSPPESADYVFDTISNVATTVIDSAQPNDDNILLGDFNKPRVKWIPDGDNPSLLRPTNSTEADNRFFDALADAGLSQICGVRSFNQLDLIFTDITDSFSVSRASHLLKPDSHHHVAIELTFTVGSTVTIDDFNPSVYDFNRANLPALIEAINSVDWDAILSTTDANAATTKFYEVIYKLFDRFVPKKEPQRRYSCRWMNRNLASARNRRNRAHRAYRKWPTFENFTRFMQYRDSFHQLNATLYRSYMMSQAELIRRDPKKFWKLVNDRRKTSGVPSNLRYGDNVGSDSSSSVNLLADYFQSVFSNSPGNIKPPHGPGQERVTDFVPTRQDVYNGLLKLDVNKGGGPDMITNSILKSLASELAHPLQLLFKTSLVTGVFPEAWKVSFITPIFKSGDRSLCNNYRAIAILSAIPKLFEKIVCCHLEDEIGNLIDPTQHGFRDRRSTCTNLALFVERALNAMNSSGQFDAVYTDFAKAFDRVDHQLLLKKLYLAGIGGSLLAWLQSYLSGRTQRVRLGNITSHPVTVTSGVPQGSHLGPLLFALFINDLCAELDGCGHLLFADDLKLFKEIRGIDDARMLQLMVERVDNWCKCNGMSLNVAKCHVISFSRKPSERILVHQYSVGGKQLQRSEVVKDLGVLLDKKLTFKSHVNQIVARAKTTLAFMKRQARTFDCPHVTKSLYTALVRPIVEYCSLVWDPVFDEDRNRIESIQKQFLLFALRHLGWADRFRLPPYQARLTLMDLDTLAERRTIAACMFVRNCLAGGINCIELSSSFIFHNPQRLTRSSTVRRLELPPMCAVRYIDNSPVRRCIVKFNKYAAHFRDGVTAISFKEALRQAMMVERRTQLSHDGYLPPGSVDN